MICRMCSAPNARVVEVGLEGQAAEVSGELCDRCFDAAVAHAAELRQQFDDLIASGISREQANAIMIGIIEGTGAKA